MKTVGIDLGHCETAGATLKETQQSYAVDHVNAQDKDKIIVTQIVLTNEQMKKLCGKTSPTKSDIDALGDILIGNKLPESVQDGEKFIYFKASPAHFDEVCASTEVGKRCGITHGMLMACFANALIKSMFSHNSGLLNEGDIEEAELLIGCPATADWTAKKSRSRYAELIRRATGVKNVEIIPESRAAMFSSVENSAAAGRRVSALNGAVVFDFGSSTADCTYMLLGRKLIEFSWTLGASAIERGIVAEAFEEAQSAESFDADTSSFVRCEDNLRRAKEEYYNGLYGPDGHDIVCAFRTSEQKQVKRMVTVDETMMNRVVNEREINIICDSNQAKGGSWYELCREFFVAARDALDKESLPVDTIVLTGGASKMGFVYELCREVFRGVLDEERILLETNPSYTVANGLVWIARCDKEIDGCIRKAKTKVSLLSTVDELKESMCGSIYELVCDLIKGEANRWTAIEDDCTYLDLLNAIKSETQSEKFKERITEICVKSVDAWKADLSDLLIQAVNEQVANLYSNEVAKEFIIPEDIWKELSGKSFDEFSFGGIGNPLSAAALNTLSNNLVRGVTQIVFLTVAGIIGGVIAAALGPLGVAIDVVVGFIIGFLADKADDALSNTLLASSLKKKRTQKKRQNFASTLIEKLPDSRNEMLENIRTELEDSLADYRNNYDAMLEDMLTAAFEIVTLKRFEK